MFKIFNSLATFKNRTALVSENNSISYQDLIKKSDKINKTIRSKTVCLMIAQNNQNFIISYVAFLRKKKVISILIDENFGEEFIQKLLKAYKPNYVLSPSKYFNLFSKENSIFNFGDYSIFETSINIHNKLDFKNYLLLSTSGTTHSPKFVRLSSLNLENNVKKIKDYLNINSSQTTITTMPIGYSYGLSILNTHLSAGAKTEVIAIACGDESTAHATGTAVVTFHMPYAFTLTGVKAGLTVAPVGSVFTVDINEAGTTILSTKITIDASEKTSGTAATAAVISDTALAADALMTIDIDGVGSSTAGAGLKVYLIGHVT